MSILVGTVPVAYALNHAVRGPEVQTFIAVSEKTKTHLTYAQGATSEVIAIATILAADRFGLPLSGRTF